MLAARLVAFGTTPTFELTEVPVPQAGVGDVVVDIHAAALNRRDPWVWQTAGYCPLPVTLGSDGAGVVSAVGAGVDGVSVGDAVVINPTLGWADGEEVPGLDFDNLGAPLDGTFAVSGGARRQHGEARRSEPPSVAALLLVGQSERASPARSPRACL